MRCLICNEIIDDKFRLISGQEEYCSECHSVIYGTLLEDLGLESNEEKANFINFEG